MNRISNKILTTPIQNAVALSETSHASNAEENPKAATSESIGKAMSNFELIKKAGSQTAGLANDMLQEQLQGNQDSGFFGKAADVFLTGSDGGVGDVAKAAVPDQTSEEQLKWQTVMERMSKAVETVSNAEKKESDLSDVIVSNLK